MYGDRTHQVTLWPLDEPAAQQDSGAAQAPTGVELVGQMAHGKPWWKLQPIDLAPWIRSLPKAVRTCKYNRLEWIGRGWDGVSDFHLGEEPWDEESDINFGEPLWEFDGEDPAVVVVSADQLQLLVAELRRMISAAPALRVALPDHRSVRARVIYDACYPGEEWAPVGFDEAERCATVHYRQAVGAALAARAVLASRGEQLALPAFA